MTKTQQIMQAFFFLTLNQRKIFVCLFVLMFSKAKRPVSYSKGILDLKVPDQILNNGTKIPLQASLGAPV